LPTICWTIAVLARYRGCGARTEEMLKAYILAIVHDPHLAEDTLSDVTLAIARSWEKFDRRLSFAPWARGIARRVALANSRKANRLIVGLDEDVLESLDAEFDAFGNEASQEEMRQQLNRCLDQLPELLGGSTDRFWQLIEFNGHLRPQHLAV